MRDDQDQGQRLDGEDNESASSASDSPSRKRLLPEPTPSQDSAAASSDSYVSWDSSSDRTRKKTRDLPNLSDCHSCGVRINSTNPQERLQTLDSAWRVVLLCKKCVKRVKLAELCSYCFSDAADSDCFQCRDCERRVHKDCVEKYRCSVPWSYFCLESEFSVCVDCWVPKSLAKSNAVGKRLRNKKIAGRACPVDADDDGMKSLEDVVNDANCAAKKKFVAAAMAKEIALRKAVVAKSAVELANGALDLMVSKDESSGKNESTGRSNSASTDSAPPPAVMDDTELAFHLHRAINSSPRISSNTCLLNSRYLVVPNIQESNGKDTARSSGLRGSSSPNVCGEFAGCTTTKSEKNLDATNSESLGYSETNGLIDEKTCITSKEYGQNGCAGLIGNSNSDDNNAKKSESLSCQKQDELGRKFHPNFTYYRRQYKWNRKDILLYTRKKKKTCDRYLIKYTKRRVDAKVLINREGKFLSNCFGVESRTVASGVSVNSFKESRIFSNAPSQSCDVPVQDSPCGTGSSQDQS